MWQKITSPSIPWEPPSSMEPAALGSLWQGVTDCTAACPASAAQSGDCVWQFWGQFTCWGMTRGYSADGRSVGKFPCLPPSPPACLLDMELIYTVGPQPGSVLGLPGCLPRPIPPGSGAVNGPACPSPCPHGTSSRAAALSMMCLPVSRQMPPFL